jgi:hypothetical protein
MSEFLAGAQATARVKAFRKVGLLARCARERLSGF